MKNKIVQLLLVLQVMSGSFSFFTNQACDQRNYILINNPRRSVQAEYDEEVDDPLCDYGIDEGTWYRFSSSTGDAIVERAANDPVPMLRCGTEVPIYIRGLGSHPQIDFTTTQAIVCANYGNGACRWMDTIQIHRCPVQGDPSYFYLYKLKSPPGCSMSYCVGKKAACTRGSHWNGTSCVRYFPAMKRFPVFSGPHIKGSGLREEIYFSCEVQYDRQPNDSNARFRVTFLFDGLPLKHIGVNATSPPESLEPTILNPDISLVSILTELHLRGRLGREISCQVESYWDGDNETHSIMTSVAKYYASFESTVESYDISLSNGSTHDVSFKSTLPFTCRHCVNATGRIKQSCCQYRFYMVTSVSSPQCTLLWKGNDTVVLTVYFVPEATQIENSFVLGYQPYNSDQQSANGRSLWRDYVIPPVTMKILPRSTPYMRCYSVADPHLKTFDNLYFDNYMVGDFYLVKVNRSNQLMEVQVRHEICNGGWVTCNCGIAVREGNSVIRISMCEAGKWSWNTQRNPTVVRLLSQYEADSSTVYIDSTGLKFSVRMPSGLRVEMNLNRPWCDVEVFLPPEYHGKTDSASMCGNSNGKSNDDFTTNLGNFRVPDHLSYFAQQPVCSDIFNVAAAKCGCNETSPQRYAPICSNKDPTLQVISKSFEPHSGKLTTGVVCGKPNQRRRRDADTSSLYDNSDSDNDFILDDDILFPPHQYDPNFGVDVSFAWPTPKGKTEQEVEHYCAGALQSSPAYADCNANADLTTIITMCKSDIQIADDWISVSAYVSAFEQDCINTIAASIKDASDSSSSNSTLEALTSVSEKLCPSQCSGQGTCSEGTCMCNTGYIGADCSIDKSRPPSLTGIIRSGICDVRLRPCDVISVYGSGVGFSSALKCRFTDLNTGDQRVTDGTFITALEYSCPVPETTTHRRRRSVTTRTTVLSAKTVSITVDGVLYSNSLDFVLFDSVCMECNSNKTCRQKDNSCLISGECFAGRAVNPDDPCLQCNPNISRKSWTNITVVEDWSPCTRACDTGVAIRRTVCGTTVAHEEVEFCKVLDCPDIAEQRKQGFGITLSSENLKLILRDPARSIVPFSDALNLYCSKNATACCNSIEIPTGVSTVTYTSRNLLTYASGYPVISNTNSSLKIIVKIDRSMLAAECSRTVAQWSNIVYGDPKLIYDAVNSEKSEIEQALSIRITSVWSTMSLPASTLRMSTANESTTSEYSSPPSLSSTTLTRTSDQPETSEFLSSSLASSAVETSTPDQSMTSELAPTLLPSATLQRNVEKWSTTPELLSTAKPSSTVRSSTSVRDHLITSERSSASLPSSTSRRSISYQTITSEWSSSSLASSTLRRSKSDSSKASKGSSVVSVSIINNLIGFWMFVILAWSK